MSKMVAGSRHRGNFNECIVKNAMRMNGRAKRLNCCSSSLSPDLRRIGQCMHGPVAKTIVSTMVRIPTEEDQGH